MNESLVMQLLMQYGPFVVGVVVFIIIFRWLWRKAGDKQEEPRIPTDRRPRAVEVRSKKGGKVSFRTRDIRKQAITLAEAKAMSKEMLEGIEQAADPLANLDHESGVLLSGNPETLPNTRESEDDSPFTTLTRYESKPFGEREDPQLKGSNSGTDKKSTCPHCGTPFAQTSAFCGQCGRKLD